MKLPEIVAVAFYMGIALFTFHYASKVALEEPKMMCGVSEINPDFSTADRALCKKRRGHRL